MSEHGKPDDPWARWRKPEAADAGEAATEKKGGASAADSAGVGPARAANAGSEPAPPAAEPARPSGTLSVRKAVKAADVADEKPRERAGGKSFDKKRREGAGGKAFGQRDDRSDGKGGKPFAKSGERREGKPWDKSAAPDRSADRFPSRAGGERSENPWGKPGGAVRPGAKPPARSPAPRAENPWAKASGSERASSRDTSATARTPFKAPAQPMPADQGGEAPSGVRLSKVMSERGLCSRREADLWISRGWVYVDGVQISELGTRIDPSADISISQDAKKDQAKQVTIILHKPVGYVSGQPEPGFTPAVTLISAETQMPQSGDPEFKPWMLRGLAPAGRLDVDSTGLLVLTQDGRVAKKLIGEDSDVEKEYLVRVSGEMIKDGLKLLNHGLELDGKPLKPARVKQLNEDQLHFILKEGKKRQIRRMCELVGLRVIGLKRVRIGRVRLGDLPMGQWRFLRADEAF